MATLDVLSQQLKNVMTAFGEGLREFNSMQKFEGRT